MHVLNCATKCLVTLRTWSGEMSKSQAMRSACRSKLGAWPWSMADESNSNRGYRQDRHDEVTEVRVLAATAPALSIFAHRSQMRRAQHRTGRIAGDRREFLTHSGLSLTRFVGQSPLWCPTGSAAQSRPTPRFLLTLPVQRCECFSQECQPPNLRQLVRQDGTMRGSTRPAKPAVSVHPSPSVYRV
jgi:hypothetical protein